MNESHDLSQEQLASNLTEVRLRIAEAAERAGRNPAEITLVAVSKTKPVELVEIAYNLGVTDFGENRVQEALPKIAHFHPAGLRWHLIGHLQSNKVARAVRGFTMIDSVDTVALLERLDRAKKDFSTELTV